jgi:hypothetical protein
MSPNRGIKIIARIKGGLGNQLFCYAAARRLALVNHAELVIDNVTGFSRDQQYRRQYALDHFRIPCRKATPAERLEPFERYRRGVMKLISHRLPFSKRRYVEQERLDFDERLLELMVDGDRYLDGLWQSEQYFKDVESTIRNDLRIVAPPDELNQRMAEKIRNTNAVSLHVRWFNEPGSAVTHNLSVEYYRRAIALIEGKIDSPHYYLFSDNTEAACALLALPENKLTFVSHNEGDENAYADLWLMSQCKHFITANSTFSWWGAWLGRTPNSVVVTPDMKLRKLDGLTAWGFKGLIPEDWLQV